MNFAKPFSRAFFKTAFRTLRQKRKNEKKNRISSLPSSFCILVLLAIKKGKNKKKNLPTLYRQFLFAKFPHRFVVVFFFLWKFYFRRTRCNYHVEIKSCEFIASIFVAHCLFMNFTLRSWWRCSSRVPLILTVFIATKWQVYIRGTSTYIRMEILLRNMQILWKYETWEKIWQILLIGLFVLFNW